MRRSTPAILTGLVVMLATLPAVAGHRHHPPHVSVGWQMGWGGWWGPMLAWSTWVDTYHPPYGPADLAVVDTDVEPERALVYLDGDLIGMGDDFDGFPDYLYLKPGRYKIEFRLGGFTPKEVTLDVEAGEYYQLNTKLDRAAGQAVVPWWEEPEGLPKGRVYGPKEDGQRAPVKRGPDPELRRETCQGPHDAVPRRAREGAALELRIKPDNASVYLDGELMGTARELSDLERGLSVPAGRHRLDVLAPNHSPRSIAVEVHAGERQQVVVELEEGTGQAPPETLE